MGYFSRSNTPAETLKLKRARYIENTVEDCIQAGCRIGSRVLLWPIMWNIVAYATIFLLTVA